MGGDPRARYGPALAQRLEPGERLLAVSEAKRPRGLAPERPPEPPPPDPHPGAKAGAMAVGGLALSGLDFVDELGHGGPTDWLTRLFFGRAAAGRLASTAAGYVAAVPAGGPVLVAVTDRRLGVFRIGRAKGSLGSGGQPLAAAKLTPLWSVPRAEVAGARRRWHRLHGARLRVSFRDGSWMELTGPLCLGGRAGELRDALSRPGGVAPA